MITAAGLVAVCGIGLVAQDASRSTVADVYEPDDDVTFVLEAGGRRLGEHWWIYRGEVELAGAPAHRFEGGVRLERPSDLGTIEVRQRGDLYTDELGHPRKFELRLHVGSVKTFVDADFAGGKATVRIVQGSAKSERELAAPAGCFLLANNWIGMVELVAALAPPEAGATRKVELFSIDAALGPGEAMLPYELRHQGPFASKRGDEAVEGVKYRDSLGEVLKVVPNGRIFEIEVPNQGLRIRRTDEKIARFELEPPAPPRADFVHEDVTIVHSADAVELAGTITRKQGLAGKLPAVFFVSGSGGQDRDGCGGGIDLGTHEILDRLTEEGFLVLRVDDRGVGGSTGPTTDMSYDDLVADARACVDFLLARPDVDAERVFLIGHSEGGETAPILACERPLAGIVLMAAPGRSMFAILREQKKAALEEARVPPAAIEAELEVHRQFLEAISSDAPIDVAKLRVDYQPFAAQRKWFQSHARRDAVAQIRQVKCPVLILQGEKDAQVSSERDAAALEKALRESGHPDATMKLFPQLDHLFKKTASDKPTTRDYLQARPIDGEFLAALTAWLKERARR